MKTVPETLSACKYLVCILIDFNVYFVTLRIYFIHCVYNTCMHIHLLCNMSKRTCVRASEQDRKWDIVLNGLLVKYSYGHTYNK